jgi:hypothetical protein
MNCTCEIHHNQTISIVRLSPIKGGKYVIGQGQYCLISLVDVTIILIIILNVIGSIFNCVTVKG